MHKRVQFLKRDCPPNKTAGVTLIELMISMSLGLLLIIMLLPPVLSNIEMFDFNKGASRLQENARFSLQRLKSDIRMTGFLGCNSRIKDVANLTGKSLFDLSQKLAGYDLAGAQSATHLHLEGTDFELLSDAITVKTLHPVNTKLKEDLVAGASTLAVNGGHEIKAGDVLLISNCQQGFTASVESVTATTVTLSEVVSSGMLAGSGADINKVVIRTYFIAASKKFTEVDNPKSFWMKENTKDAQELLVGIEDLQIHYGVDNDGDLVVDTFYSAGWPGENMNNVNVLRLQVTATSIDEVGRYGLLQKTFLTTVNLRNSYSG